MSFKVLITRLIYFTVNTNPALFVFFPVVA